MRQAQGRTRVRKFRKDGARRVKRFDREGARVSRPLRRVRGEGFEPVEREFPRRRMIRRGRDNRGFKPRRNDGPDRVDNRKGGKPAPRKFKKDNHKKPAEDRDLDRELRNYWTSKHGQQKAEDVKQLAKQRMNNEMDDYWKKREEQKQKAE